MAETEDIQPLVCDNGTGMVKVNSCGSLQLKLLLFRLVIFFSHESVITMPFLV